MKKKNKLEIENRVEDILFACLPYYESEDKDNVLYIANYIEVQKVAKIIAGDNVLLQLYLESIKT